MFGRAAAAKCLLQAKADVLAVQKHADYQPLATWCSGSRERPEDCETLELLLRDLQPWFSDLFA